MKKIEEYNPKMGLFGSLIISIHLFLFLILLNSIDDINLINSWILLSIGTGIILMGDYFLQFYREKAKKISFFVFLTSIISGLLFILIFFYELLRPSSSLQSIRIYYLIILLMNFEKYITFTYFVPNEIMDLWFLLKYRLWQIQFNLFGLFFCLLGVHFLYNRSLMKNRKISIGTGTCALIIGIIGLIYSNLFIAASFNESSSFNFFMNESFYYFSLLKAFSFFPLIFINILIGFVFYRQTQIRTVIIPLKTRFPLYSIFYLVIGIGLLIPGIPFLFLSLLLIVKNILVCLRNVSFWLFFFVAPGFYFVLEFINIINDYTEAQDLILEELDEVINQESYNQPITEEKQVQNIEKEEVYESSDHIDQYNDPEHEFYKSINKNIEKVDNYLKTHPNYPLEDQLRMAELEPLEKSCPNCRDYLFLYKKFLIYCANCEKFISELIRLKGKS